MNIKYHDVEFSLEIEEIDEYIIQGRLILDPDKEKIFRKLHEAESESWYLSKNGERLESEELFEASPWKFNSPNGEVKLLCRFHDMYTGEIRFNTQDGYGGELFKWVRE
ncbi:hypothetical protein ACJJH9_06920 [Microbulbifer sp. DLAB2-AF]|uniref:hypothetical protein n=1 Tax=unclassified Microbulbifer TaxID=2619833 RepID=UPI00403A327E